MPFSPILLKISQTIINIGGNTAMGLSSKKQKDIPQELQPFNGPRFETIPAYDNSHRHPKTGVAIPTQDAIDDIKAWINVTKL